jgi:hypothetical protein
MNAVIWLRVMAEAHTPIATNAAAASIVPAYWATATPTSGSPPAASASQAAAVAPIATARNPRTPMNLPSRYSTSPIGCASTSSIVPDARSSAIERIVTAGTKNSSSHGMRSNIGRRLAWAVRNADRKKKKNVPARKTTSRMYAVGWSKKPRNSRPATAPIRESFTRRPR